MMMLEVFVAFKKGDDLAQLEATLDGWDREGLEPVAIQCGKKKFELHRRVTAENVSRGDYILADLGTEPLEPNFGKLAEDEIEKHKDVALFGASLENTKMLVGSPYGVVLCRKGAIEKWPEPKSETYIKEHVEACRLAGHKTLLCNGIHYRHITASSPS